MVTLVDTLLDRMEAQGEVDLIRDYAAAVPVEVIGNLLRVPREDRGPLRGWSLAILGALEPAPTAEQLAAGNRAVTEFCAYLRELIAQRRRHPRGDDDLLTRLLGDDQLTETELAQNCVFLLNAGHETTTNLIGNGLHLLLRIRIRCSSCVGRPAADRDGGRGMSALRELESARQPARRRTHSRTRRRARTRARISRCASAPRIAIRRSLPMRTGSTSRDSRTDISPSPPARSLRRNGRGAPGRPRRDRPRGAAISGAATRRRAGAWGAAHDSEGLLHCRRTSASFFLPIMWDKSIRCGDCCAMRAASRPDERHHHDAQPAADPEEVECGNEVGLAGQGAGHTPIDCMSFSPSPCNVSNARCRSDVVDAARFGQPALVQGRVAIPEGRRQSKWRKQPAVMRTKLDKTRSRRNALRRDAVEQDAEHGDEERRPCRCPAPAAAARKPGSCASAVSPSASDRTPRRR